MKKLFILILLGLSLSFLAGSRVKTSGQDGGCAIAKAEEAILVAAQDCWDIETNQICYAHSRITSIFSDGRFFQVGEYESLANFRELITEPGRDDGSQAPAKWGIAVVRVKAPAKIAENRQGYLLQDVTMVAYGNPTVENAGVDENDRTHFIVRMQGNLASPCSEIYKAGVILEAPTSTSSDPQQFLGEIVINGILFRLHSRALLTMTGDNTKLRVVGLEGAVEVITSDGKSVTLQPKQFAEIELKDGPQGDSQIITDTGLPPELSSAEQEELANHPQELGALGAAHTELDPMRQLEPGQWRSVVAGNREDEERVIVPGDVDVWAVEGHPGQELTVWLACPNTAAEGGYRCLSIGLRLPAVSLFDPDGNRLASGTAEHEVSLPPTLVTDNRNYLVVAGGNEISTGRYLICAEYPDTPCGAVPVIPNAAPIIEIADQATVNVGQVLEIPLTVTDPEGGSVTINAQSGNSTIVTAFHRNPLVLTGVSEGTAIVTLTAVDEDNVSTSKNITVNVQCVPCQNASFFYTVARSDTLYNISVRAKTTVNDVMIDNCLHTDLIQEGQQLCVRSTFGPLPDLIPTIKRNAANIICEIIEEQPIQTSYVTAPCTIQVPFTVTNNGGNFSQPMDVLIQAAADTTVVSIPALAPQQSQEYTASLQTTTGCFIGGRSCRVTVTADYTDMVQETIEINNFDTVDFPAPFAVLPDLQVWSLDYYGTPTLDGIPPIRLVVLNGSDVDISGGFFVQVTVTVNDSVPQTYTYSVNGLPHGQYTIFDLTGLCPHYDHIDCHIQATIDPDNMILEADEDNNTATLRKPQPELSSSVE